MNAIVAIDQNWGIGRDGALLFRISADLKRFRALTTGHSVILGRKTLATFPGGTPLPGRRNLILSRDTALRVAGAEVFHDMEALRAAAPADAFVIGGAQIYRALLPDCETVYVTKVDAAMTADAFFPALDADADWLCTDPGTPQTAEGLTFRYLTYCRRH